LAWPERESNPRTTALEARTPTIIPPKPQKCPFIEAEVLLELALNTDEAIQYIKYVSLHVNH
jgi:hypothetical protein